MAMPLRSGTEKAGLSKRLISRLRRRGGGGLAPLSPLEQARALPRCAKTLVRGGLLSMTLEVTKRCNARCDFCDHWREPKRQERADFADVVRRLDPLVVVFCGGEPLLRRDIVELVRRVSGVPGWRYQLLITNGWLLDEELGVRLCEAGLHQLDVSLNWPDRRQNEERGLGGLFERVERVVPALAARGVAVHLNTMIMRENLDEIPRIARLAAEWGARVGYTLYSETCNGNEAHQLRPEEAVRLGEVVEELIELKGRFGRISNNSYYLRRCVSFARGERFSGCVAGRRMVHISPQGMVKPCADLEPIAHYTEFDIKRSERISCEACWMACRGEVEAPVDLDRVRELVGWQGAHR
jgi:MoaA/NifB/PqqE/SkfB family radical SAM enzyme